MLRTPWWKGTRGEWYVVGQIALMVLVFLGPQTWSGLPGWTFYPQLCSIIGSVLLVVGGILLFAGIFKLGANLTAMPYPKEQGTLIETGPYQCVRHPMYGGILIPFGWALWVQGWLTLAYAIILLIFFDIKSRREERWLKEKFSGYVAYQKRVRKLIPFVY